MENAGNNYQSHVDCFDRQEWSKIVASFPNSNLYQNWEYGAVTWSGDELSHIAVSLDNSLIAAAQVRIKRLPLIGQGVAYVRWGPLVSDDSTRSFVECFEIALDALKEEYVSLRKLSLILVPRVFAGDEFSQSVRDALERKGFVGGLHGFSYRTFCLELTPPVDELRKGLNQKWRNMLKGAEKNALTVTQDDSLSSFDVFLKLYDEMLARKGFEESVDPRQFRQMQETLVPELKMRVFLCSNEEGPVCGAIVSLQGESGIYLFGGTSEAALPLKAAYLLHWEIIAWLKENGARYYDLGGIDPEANPGVYRFKKGFSGSDSSLVPAQVFTCGWIVRLFLWMQSLRRFFF